LIVSSDSGTFCYQDFLDAANNLSPHPFPPERVEKLPKGTPGGGKDAVHPTSYDHSKRKRVLGFKTYTVQETTRDVIADYHARGW
jgi:nucleoside-diphosphate-sugar epimerase